MPARTEKKLSPKGINAATLAKDGQWINDGGGLYLRLHASGEKTFYYRYRHPRSKRLEWVKIGRYGNAQADYSLAEARDKAGELKRLCETGVSPAEHQEDARRQIDEERRQLQEAEQAAALEVTVGGLFGQWFSNRILPEFKRPDWIKRDVMGGVLAYEFKPDGQNAVRFENIPAKAVTRAHIVEIIESTQQRGANALANDQLRYLERMFEYGMTKDHLDLTPFAKIEKRAIRKREQARERALTRDEMKTVLTTLAGMRASWQVQTVIAMTLFTAQRTGYVCRMGWSEIHGDEWRIPAGKQQKEERRKSAPKDHVVYLPDQAIELLERIRNITGKGRYVFKSERAGPDGKDIPISQASIEKSIGRHLRPMPGQGFRSDKRTAEGVAPYWVMPHFNAHDLRRSVATRMAEDVAIMPHVIEKILNHAPSNELAAIYNKASYERERKDAALKWGEYLAGLSANNVLPFRVAA